MTAVAERAHRIVVDSYYTDGKRLAEIVDVTQTGYVHMRDCHSEAMIGRALGEFRSCWWLVKAKG